MLKRPSRIDAAIACLFVVLITFQPYFLHGKINLFELGIYLPGIDAVLSGKIPYRDFFYLRGPFELYMPALAMRVWGEKISILMACFYAGTILTLFLYVLTAQKILKTRLVFYLMTFVLVARTFPRVVFTYWGGIRFALGILAILGVVLYFQRGKKYWLGAAGMACGCAVLTSVDVGVSAVLAIGGVLLCSFLTKIESPQEIINSCAVYLLGFLMVLVPYAAYLACHAALIPYGEAVGSVVANLQHVFNMHFTSDIPYGAGEALSAALNPANKSFKHMTPVYLYSGMIFYWWYQLRRRRAVDRPNLGIIALAIYGGIMYMTAFRNIEAAQFEMALQPEKILLFFLLEEAYLFLKPRKVAISRIFLVFCVLSSAGYFIQRYNHRFFAFQYVRNKIIGKETANLRPLDAGEIATPQSSRVRGLVVPKSQAEDFDQIVRFMEKNTDKKEAVFMFPELGAYYFIVDRPFVGRFPMVTFSWLNDRWHEELLSDIKKARPRFVVMDKELAPRFRDTYFKVRKNFDEYNEVLEYINTNYRLIQSTPSLNILALEQ